MDFLDPLVDLARRLVDLFLHLDVHLTEVTGAYGGWTYALLFLIIFCETGLVVTPILPGDSLLFLAGVAASPVAEKIFGDGVRLSLPALLIGAPICAIVGAQLGHFLGARYGRRLFDKPDSRLFKLEYVAKAEHYFEKFGPAKAVVLARFIPIVRTFTPFVAGVGAMTYPRFLAYSLFGAALWVNLFVWAGYFFGNLPFVRENFTVVVLVIIFLSVLPIVIGVIRDRRNRIAPA